MELQWVQVTAPNWLASCPAVSLPLTVVVVVAVSAAVDALSVADVVLVSAPWYGYCLIMTEVSSCQEKQQKCLGQNCS